MTEPSASPDPSFQKAVYEQDAQFVRYRDGLKWGRFQTASAVEGATLYAVFQMPDLALWERVAVIGFASVLVILIFVQVILDDRESGSHLRRMKAFEQKAEMPYLDPRRRPLRFKTTRIVMVFILLSNAVVALRLLWPQLRILLA